MRAIVTRMNDGVSRSVRLGGCQCGSVRYELTGEALELYVCHCNECRKQSASAFGISVVVQRAAVHLTQGSPKFWSRTTGTGHTLECAFCPECGSRVWHQSSAISETINIKAGSLDEPIDLRSAVHIWTSRMMPGIIVADTAVQFPGEPE